MGLFMGFDWWKRVIGVVVLWAITVGIIIAFGG